MNMTHYRQWTFSFLLSLSVGLLLGAESVQAQPGGLQLPGFTESLPSEPKIEMKFVPARAAVGEIVTAEIKIQIDRKSYLYSLNPNKVGAETRIKISETIGLEPIDAKFTPLSKPKSVVEPLFQNATLEKFYGGVTWKRKYKVTGKQAPQLKGTLIFQVCDDVRCNPFEKPIVIAGELGASIKPLPDLGALPEEKSPPNFGSLFADNKSGTSPALPVLQGKLLDSKKIHPTRESTGKNDPIDFEIKLLDIVESASAEKTIAVVITATMEGDWHLYAQTQDPKMFGLPTVIDVNVPETFAPIDSGFIPTESPQIVHPDVDITQEVFHHQITWQKRYRVTGNESLGLQGTIKYQMCVDGSCLPPNTVEFSLGETTQIANNIDGSSQASAPVEESNKLIEEGLIPFLITGVVFGYLALLTPCVFPMIPITVSFFLKQAEKEDHNAIGMATFYCLGIIGTFTVIGLVVSIFFGGSGMTQAANLPWLNIFIAAVLIFFGMSLLGLFEIRVPTSALTWSSSNEQQGGYLGVLFMSFTFTLVSFTCTFAFVGSLLPMAAQGNYYWPVLGMIAFSTAFASPFFFLALFPSFLKKLPQSGGWMNRVKVTMGLIEIGAAFKFLSVADIGWFSVPYFFDYALVMTSWMVLCIVAGIYLLGFFKLPHDTPSDSIGVIQLSFAMTFLGFAAYLATGIFGAHPPEGAVWEQIVSFAPPSFESENDVELGHVLEHDGLVYALDVDQAIKYADAKKQPLFYDFTGVNCVNCRFMEINVLSKNENKKLLEKFVRVQLYIDTIPAMTDKQQVEKLLEKNRALQTSLLKSASMPAYAVVTPDGKKILSSYDGKERAPGQFTRFLEAGLTEWEREKVAMTTETTTR